MSWIPHFFNKVLDSPISRQFLKFGFVGSVGALINMSVFYLTHKILGINYIICSILAFAVAVTTNFIFNKVWTFKDYDKTQIWVKYYKYVTTNIGGLIVNLLVLVGLTRILGMQVFYSQILGIASGATVNFIGSRTWVFGVKKSESKRVEG